MEKNESNLSSDSQDSKNVKEEVNNDLDPFAYVVNNGFTSEIFKVEIRGLPRYYGIGEFRKLLKSKLKLDCSKVKSPKGGSPWLYACFRSEEERKKAISLLSGYKWKGSILSVKTADPVPDPLIKRRLEESNDSPNKKIKYETPEEQKEALLMSVAPKWNVAYENQINNKHENAKSLLIRLGMQLVRANPLLKDWIENQKQLNEGLPCKLLNTRFLENEPNCYRNKCEFTIGKDEVTEERRVGFRLGSYASGSISVGPIDDIPTLPKIVIESAKVFEKFVQKSQFEVFSPKDLSGHWKQLTVRLGMGTGEVMVVVGFHPQNLNAEEISTLKEEIKEFYKCGAGAESRVDSLHFQLMKRKERGSQGSEYELLLGKECIEEILCGLKFKISPASFFQINTRCAEVLMKTVRELSNIDQDTVLVDVCCGTGTIGLCLAKDCSRVLGIEIVEQAVKDAKENAVTNEISNCEFFCGKADEILDSVMSRVKENEKCVAILDPPRAGLHPKAILMLRRPKNLDRIVFMSCDGNAAFNNFVELGRNTSKTLSGDPFLPIAAVAVDMFPHTDHYELVLYFERVSREKLLSFSKEK
ncbi:tRNA (uracil-5-)-methyltransferase homolog A [Halyomorpha halys]|uniref:tRNA (uracil-5-)-methyltransferase homolog A n=1 Tax=Halyomorpha halys TaxID=286706 RepID=UPI0006D5295D|nr:tRNA (uracil-5-)-methyltransferase homolog A [Halyomorpha halys]